MDGIISRAFSDSWIVDRSRVTKVDDCSWTGPNAINGGRAAMMQSQRRIKGKSDARASTTVPVYLSPPFSKGNCSPRTLIHCSFAGPTGPPPDLLNQRPSFGYLLGGGEKYTRYTTTPQFAVEEF